MSKKFKPNPYITLLRNIKQLDTKINFAYRLKDSNKIYIYMVESMLFDERNHPHPNRLCRILVNDINFLKSRGYDVHQVYEPDFDLIIFFVEHNDSLINLLPNLKRFKR